MDNNSQQQQIDQTALNLSRAIRYAEGGDYNNRKGDNGTSAGAYQFNNGKIPLKNGDIPANFKSWASELGLDPNDFSPTNQDHVAYERIKKDLDSGLTQSQIAAKWNSGLTHGWENHVGSVVINGKTINYDTPAYVNKVKNKYEELLKNPNPINDSGSGYNPKSYTGTVQGTTTEDTTSKPIGVEAVNNFAENATGVGGLTKGLGYTLSNAFGSQKEIEKSIQDAIDVQTRLIKRIQQNKKIGRDTTRLEKALKGITENIKNIGNQSENLTTGGIKDSDVLKSAGRLALLPATAYAGSLLSGTSALPSFQLGSKIDLISKIPAVQYGLKGIGVDNATFNSFSNSDKVEALTHIMSNAGVVDRAVIQQVISKLLPSAIEEAGGSVAFSQTHPILAKAGGLIGELLKGIIPAGAAGAAYSAYQNTKTP